MTQKATHGGVLAGLLLTILILSALGFAALVATGVFIAHHVRVTERAGAGETNLETPFGSIRLRDRNAESHRLGLPVYPGSVRQEDPKFASLELDLGGRHHGIRLQAAEYRTSDSVEKVTEYYRHRFPHWLLSEREHGLRLEFTEGGYRKVVAIRNDDGETRIGLASVGDGASNSLSRALCYLIMPEYCTCGAQLPPDARFCHRCGKPQREEILEEPLPVREPEIPPAAAPVGVMPQGVSFHNPIAVRIGLMVASIAALLTLLLLFGFVIWWISAGFFSVYLYRRRTGEVLTVSGGLRMGWLTGVLTFVIVTVLMTMGVVAAVLQSGGLGSFYAELLRSRQFNEATIQQTVQAMNNPSVLATGIILTLIFAFAMITVFCTAGGALGAKLAGKQ